MFHGSCRKCGTTTEIVVRHAVGVVATGFAKLSFPTSSSRSEEETCHSYRRGSAPRAFPRPVNPTTFASAHSALILMLPPSPWININRRGSRTCSCCVLGATRGPVLPANIRRYVSTDPLEPCVPSHRENASRQPLRRVGKASREKAGLAPSVSSF